VPDHCSPCSLLVPLPVSCAVRSVEVPRVRRCRVVRDGKHLEGSMDAVTGCKSRTGTTFH